MGIDFLLRSSVKVLFFVAYITLIQFFIYYMFDFANNYFLSFDSEFYMLINYFGIFHAIALFLNILTMSYSIKSAISYWKNI